MKVLFNFKKSTCSLNWVRILKVVFRFDLKEAKAIVDSGSYVQQYFVDLLIRLDSACISLLNAEQRKVEFREVISLSIYDDEENVSNNTPATSIDMQDIDTAKIGSVYILTQERYEKLLKAEQTWLMIKAALCNE